MDYCERNKKCGKCGSKLTIEGRGMDKICYCKECEGGENERRN